MKIWTLAAVALSLVGCADDYTSEKESSIAVCQGFGCETQGGKKPTNAATHKPTKGEKIRARQGASPDFGSDDIRVGISVPY